MPTLSQSIRGFLLFPSFWSDFLYLHGSFLADLWFYFLFVVFKFCSNGHCCSNSPLLLAYFLKLVSIITLLVLQSSAFFSLPWVLILSTLVDSSCCCLFWDALVCYCCSKSSLFLHFWLSFFPLDFRINSPPRAEAERRWVRKAELSSNSAGFGSQIQAGQASLPQVLISVCVCVAFSCMHQICMATMYKTSKWNGKYGESRCPSIFEFQLSSWESSYVGRMNS